MDRDDTADLIELDLEEVSQIDGDHQAGSIGAG